MSVKIVPRQEYYDDLRERLTTRAKIRRQIPGRKSVEEGTPDRIADILEEAAEAIKDLQEYKWMYEDLNK